MSKKLDRVVIAIFATAALIVIGLGITLKPAMGAVTVPDLTKYQEPPVADYSVQVPDMAEFNAVVTKLGSVDDRLTTLEANISTVVNAAVAQALKDAAAQIEATP